jgi:hypothetical protein
VKIAEDCTIIVIEPFDEYQALLVGSMGKGLGDEQHDDSAESHQG